MLTLTLKDLYLLKKVAELKKTRPRWADRDLQDLARDLCETEREVAEKQLGRMLSDDQLVAYLEAHPENRARF